MSHEGCPAIEKCRRDGCSECCCCGAPIVEETMSKRENLGHMMEGFVATLDQEQLNAIMHSGILKIEQVMTFIEISKYALEGKEAEEATRSGKKPPEPEPETSPNELEEQIRYLKAEVAEQEQRLKDIKDIAQRAICLGFLHGEEWNRVFTLSGGKPHKPIKLQAGHFYLSMDGQRWCCFVADESLPEHRQAECICVTTQQVEYFYIDGRYAKNGCRPETLVSEAPEERDMKGSPQ